MLFPVDTAAVSPPEDLVTLDQAKQWLNLRTDDHNQLLTLQISAMSAYLDGPSGVLGRALGGGTYLCRYEGVTTGAVLASRLCGRLASDATSGTFTLKPKYRHGLACFEAPAGLATNLEAELELVFEPANDPRAQTLALTLVAQMFEFREESVAEQIRSNPAVRRLVTALKSNWLM